MPLDLWILEEKWTRAKCIDAPDTIFFPDKITPTRVLSARLYFCRACPVAEDCIRKFLHEESGIFSGTSPHERVDLRNVLENGGEEAFKRNWVEILDGDAVDKKAESWF